MKGWKAITGAVLTLAIAVAALFGVQPTPESELPEWAASIAMLITTGFSIYGRIVAKGPAAPQLQKAIGTIE